MNKVFEFLKDFIIILLKKILELLNFLCKMYSACMRYDFNLLEDNKKDKEEEKIP